MPRKDSGRKLLGSGPRTTMPCPKCRAPHTHIHFVEGVGAYIRRRRKCLKCEHRFTTYEGETRMETSAAEAIGGMKAKLGLLMEEIERTIAVMKGEINGE